ncbi:MAG TPA: YbjQ family protein [Firmicutes bacterium]|uniref:UPF0145 protein IMF26_03390 n=1 Tax=Candidatus Fermentithermobacillus carboniphilus TaxID=3085328 RepID=A0AAT9LDK2_9FIRM|nr:MAG: YbjQ family protein [Candidatus Fermentithermobacillus carboniphilus]HHW18573.1 YbjQ family protein [Candidatus Fermentithermobacillaceae bacterium]
MIVTTTPTIEGRKITAYLGIVAGEVALGTDFVRDFVASISDFFGTRTGAYEEKLLEARQACLTEMSERARKLGADAVVAVKVDHEILDNGMMLVIATGTAVKLSQS